MYSDQEQGKDIMTSQRENTSTNYMYSAPSMCSANIFAEDPNKSLKNILLSIQCIHNYVCVAKVMHIYI